ncbi:hypothetical protein EI77_03205 [Prosthecobacter fusiformis]|uniref:Dolichyl-phosphate-mannose-protein mannosyltransferase n=1 Tax=Prosthecobacter fusiformis TaxID=48464 RepID=A0A4R7RT01_9BACT|nr:hypothetical protein [Prosthecobacter fusiformis]TDU68088.1 hypothetical protein EI77_03205 [Prosthecobacter fusiformis]
MSLQPPNTASNPLLRLAFYGIAVGMALVHVFITFRGLSSEEGMEQAQMAREMARGKYFQTKVIRPYAWALLNEAGKEPDPMAMPDITQPPLQPLIWAPAFKLLEKHHVYEPGKNGAIYLLDRVIACFGVTGMLLTLLWTHGAARKLFDETVAGVAVLALLVCEPLWELTVSGSPVTLLLPLMALAFRLLVAAVTRAHQGKGTTMPLMTLGITAALMVLTHWMAVWLVLGLILAVAIGLPNKKGGAVWVAVIPALALSGWGWWMQQRCGDPLGGAKTLFQTHLLSLGPSVLQRQYSLAMPPVQVTDLLRKLLLNWQTQLGDVFSHLGYGLPALFFMVAMMHRFRRAETTAIRLGLGAIFGMVILGMGFIGLPDRRLDDNQLYLILVPALTVFGTAMLAVLWARVQGNGNSLWIRWGYAFIALGISALPLLNILPAQVKLGLTLRNRIYPHWPPYVPDRVSLVRRLIEPNEIVFSDAPGFVAWYADSVTAWIPTKRDDFELMKKRAEEHGNPVAGFVMTPKSTRVEHVQDAFIGPYSEWTDLLFRGLMLAFDRDFLPRPDFIYRVPVPLVAVPLGAKENLSLQMTFYTDRPRTLKE